MAVTLAKRTDRPGVSLAKATDRPSVAPLTTIAGVPLAKAQRLFAVLVQDGEILNSTAVPDDGYAAEAIYVEAFTHCLEVHEVTAVDRYDAHTRVARELATA